MSQDLAGNVRKMRLVFIAVTVAVGLLIASTPPVYAQAASKSVESLESVVKELTGIKVQVQGAMDALTKMTSSEASNLSKDFKDYSKNVEALQKTQEKATKRAEDLKANREAYFQAWDKKMEAVTSPEVKAHMAERQAAVRATFESVQPAAQTVRDTFPNFLTELKDIQQMLSVDLSKAGVASAAPIGQKAIADGTAINASLDTLIASLQKITAELSPK